MKIKRNIKANSFCEFCDLKIKKKKTKTKIKLSWAAQINTARGREGGGGLKQSPNLEPFFASL